ncbi:MAG: tellurite resistance TerB family protein [Planctomycetota bacterium]|jgi:DnaJ like chaperone protein
MDKLLIPVLIVLAASAAVNFPCLVSRSRFVELVSRFKSRVPICCSKLLELIDRIKFKDLIDQFRFSDFFRKTKFRTFREPGPDRSPESSKQLDMSILNCRVKLAELKEDNSVLDAFSVEVRGSIHAPVDRHYARLRISILDVTEPAPKTKEVQASVKQWQMPNSLVFCYKADLGKLPQKITTLPGWTAIAQLRLDWLVFPRKGTRTLQFNISILSCDSGEDIAGAQCTFSYDNPTFGYMDLQENIERTKTLAVALAFAVSATDNKLYDCEVELIKNWARDNIFEDSEQASNKVRHKLDKALDKTVAFFREGNKLNVYEICREIVEIVPVAQRYDILDLCLYVAQANGSVAAEELALLKDLAGWLEIDAERFRTMMEKVLPIDMHEVRDVETILGITSNMSKEKTRQHLNTEYSKWNSRVTNSDPEIQTQADQMLKLITEARSQYIAEDSVQQKEAKVPNG